MKNLALAAMAQAFALVAGCSFQASIDPEKYFPCMPDGSCPAGCRCLAGQACVPEKAGQPPELCEWCPKGKVNCDGLAGNGCEAELALDPRNCGICGRACDLNEYCLVGVCTGRCELPYQICGRLCVNLGANHEHCGKCNLACGPEQVCSSGECKDSCPAGTVPCAGACVDTKSDPANCGGCGDLCLIPNGIGRCREGDCLKESCLDPYRDCNGNVIDGCESDVSSNNDYCGNCYTDCGDHGLCSSGTCGCESGWANCDNNLLNGCETDITSNENCGHCGHECPPTERACSPEGDIIEVYYECDGATCERNTVFVTACESDCQVVGQCVCRDGVCLGGSCGQVTCRAREFCADEVDGICACGSSVSWEVCSAYQYCCDGLCVLINNANCEGCGIACPPASTCLASGDGNGLCICIPGHGDCDGNMADNGCETLLKSDPNCGDCGFDCPPDSFCYFDVNSGTATCEECPFGFMDCDGQSSNGCETDIFSDHVNCGGCGTVCGASACCGGECIDLVNNSENCGMCYNACVGDKPCNSGRCGSVGVLCISDDWTGVINCDPGLSCCFDLANVSSCETHDNSECRQRNWELQCDDSADCAGGLICCLFEFGTVDNYVTKCIASCEARYTVCASNGDCPSEYVCCEETITAGAVNFGIWLCRETCN